MKKLFAVLLLCVSTIAIAQNKDKNSFVIEGTINGLQTGKALLQYQLNGIQKTITAEIKNNSFVFQGHLEDPQQVVLNLSHDDFNGSISFFAENSDIKIKAETADLLHAVIEGSNVQKDFEAYQQNVQAIDKKFSDLNETGKNLYLTGKLTELIKDSLFKVHFDLEYEKYKLIEAFTKMHASSAVSAWAILTNLTYDPKLEILEPLYNTLSVANQSGLYGKQIKETIEITRKIAIGKPAINFTQKDINGKAISLSSFKGKYVLVDFWASWCGPCRAENPNIVRLYNEHKEKGFDILGVSLDSDKDAWVQAIKADHLTWTEISDLNAWANSAAVLYGVKGIPFNLLLDKNGVIIAKNLRGVDLANKLKEILN
jgi:peroxiredoxin